MCGIEITNGNWEDVLNINLKARDDLIYDGTKTRTVKFYIRHENEGVIYFIEEISQIAVSIENFNYTL